MNEKKNNVSIFSLTFPSQSFCDSCCSLCVMSCVVFCPSLLLRLHNNINSPPCAVILEFFLTVVPLCFHPQSLKHLHVKVVFVAPLTGSSQKQTTWSEQSSLYCWPTNSSFSFLFYADFTAQTWNDKWFTDHIDINEMLLCFTCCENKKQTSVFVAAQELADVTFWFAYCISFTRRVSQSVLWGCAMGASVPCACVKDATCLPHCPATLWMCTLTACKPHTAPLLTQLSQCKYVPIQYKGAIFCMAFCIPRHTQKTPINKEFWVSCLYTV